MISLRCLIATEEEVAGKIVTELQSSGLYPGWSFVVCSNARDLGNWSFEDIDVLVVSRTLPGEEPIGLLKRLRLTFMTAHIVLLVGKTCEQQRTYIKVALKHGLSNIVTGKLPGDRPYNIFTALTTSKDPDKDGYYGISDEDFNDAPFNERNGLNPTDTTGFTEEKVYHVQPNSYPDSTGQLQQIIKSGAGENQVITSKLRGIINMLDHEQDHEKGEFYSIVTNKTNMGSGISVFSFANKGGVGKTTVATTVAVALAKADIPTLLVDFDLGSPNVASLLGLNKVPGIEVLVDKPVTPNILRNVIVRCNGLDVLPGPQNKTIPNFRPGQLLEILKVLTQMYPVVIADTPPEYWTKPWLAELFSVADYILAVVDQSILSEQDTKNYGPYLLSMGVAPGKIGIVLNRFSPKLHNPKTVESMFCSGFKKHVKDLPKVIAVIPEDWDTHVLKGYKGQVSGLNDVTNQWHLLAKRIAGIAGYNYRQIKSKEEKEKKSFKGLFGGFLKFNQ